MRIPTNIQKHRKDPGFISLLNWYPKEVDRLPLGIARIVCQRSNMRWDSELRKNIFFYLGLNSAIMFVILLIIWNYRELSLKTLFEKVDSAMSPILGFINQANATK